MSGCELLVKQEQGELRVKTELLALVDKYLSRKYQGQEKETELSAFKFNNFYYSQEVIGKILAEKRSLQQKWQLLLPSVMRQGIVDQRALVEQGLAADFVSFVLIEIKDLKDLKVADVANPNTDRYYELVNYTSDSKTIGESSRDLGAPEMLSFPPGSFRSLDKTTPLDYELRVDKFYDNYIIKGQFDEELAKPLPQEEMDELRMQMHPNLLVDLIKNFVIMSSRHMDHLLGQLDKLRKELHGKNNYSGAESILARTFPVYVERFKEHKMNFFALKDAIEGIHARFDLNSIFQRELSEKIAQDLKHHFRLFCEEIKTYSKELIACAKHDEREGVGEYLGDMIEHSLVTFTHNIEEGGSAGPSLFHILREGIDEFESSLFAITNLDRGVLQAFSSLSKQNGATNHDLLLMINSSVLEGYKELENLVKQSRQVENLPFVAPKIQTPLIKAKTSSKPKRAAEKPSQKQQPKQDNTKARVRSKRSQANTDLPLNVRRETAADHTGDWAVVQRKKRPSELKALRVYADQRMAEGDFVEASECYKEVLTQYTQQQSVPTETYWMVNFHLVQSLSEIGRYQAALENLNLFPENWQQLYPMQLALATIYMGLGRMEEARDLCTRMAIRWKDNKLVLQAVARYHQLMKEHYIAHSIFVWLRDHHPGLTSTLDLVLSYAKMGKHREALAELDNLSEEQREDRLVIFLRVECYLIAHKYQKALDLLDKYAKTKDLKQDKRFFMKYMACLLGGARGNALEFLNQIPENWRKDKNVAFLHPKYFFKKKDYRQTLVELEKLDELWKDDAEIFYLLCVSYRKTNQLQLALKSAQRYIELFPSHIQAHLELIYIKQKMKNSDQESILNDYRSLQENSYFSDRIEPYLAECTYLLNQDLALAEEKIAKAIKKFPTQSKFYILEIRFLIKQNRLQEVGEKLKKALDQFQDNPSLLVEKIRYLKLCGRIEEAKAARDEALEEFAGNAKFTALYKQAYNKTKGQVKEIGEAQSLSRMIPKEKLRLPPMSPIISQAFAKLSQVPGKHYLTGSTAMILVKHYLEGWQWDESMISDLDFSCYCNPEDLLKIEGIRKSPHRKNLYTLRLETGAKPVFMDIEVREVPNQDMEAALLSNAKEQDYKVGALFIEQEADGTALVHEVLEGTFADIKNNVLDTPCYYPPIVLEEDAVRPLRGMKYITQYGLSPTPSLDYAFIHWQATSLKVDYPHVLHQLIRYFESHPDSVIVYLTNLNTAGILGKIFNHPSQLPYAVLREFNPFNVPEDFLYRFSSALREEFELVNARGFASSLPVERIEEVISDEVEPVVPAREDLSTWPPLDVSDRNRFFAQPDKAPNLQQSELAEPSVITKT